MTKESEAAALSCGLNTHAELAPVLELDAFDRTIQPLCSALELDAVLDAAVAAFVPAWVDWVSITLTDARGLRHGRNAGVRGLSTEEFDFPLRSGEEQIGTLRVACAPGHSRIAARDLQRLVHHAGAAITNARLYERERNVALRFANAALQAQFPPIGRFSFDSFYQAGKAEALIGGDWFDAFGLRDGRIVVSIGDVVGSGLDAALAMMNVRQAIRGVAQVHADPSLMLDAADRTLRAQYPDRYVTAFVGVIDATTQNLTFSNAGHPAPYVQLGDGTLTQLHGHAMPIGIGVEQTITVHHARFPSRAKLVLYTDGLTEASKDLIEGETRLEQALAALETAPLRGSAEGLYNAVVGAHARDDVAILIVSCAQGMPIRRWRFDPVWPDVARRARGEIVAELERARLGSGARLDAEVVFAELMGNVLRYAPGTIEIIFEQHDGRFVLHALDNGPGFAFAPRLPSDLFSQSGRGLFLISQLAEEFSVERRPGGGSHARIVLKNGDLP